MIEHEIAELLPFYANGTLDAADRARVEAELGLRSARPSCASCNRWARRCSARADAAPPLPEHVLDAALARIAVSPTALAATRLHTAWWGTPARYATAAALVVGVSAAAFAACEAHVAATSSDQAYVGQKGPSARAPTCWSIVPARTTPRPTAARPPAFRKRIAADAAEESDAGRAGAAASSRAERAPRTARARRRGHAQARASGGARVRRRRHGARRREPAHAGAVHGAQLTVEVPASRLDGTLDTLAALGTVQNRAIDAEDVDAAIVDEEARLRNLRREEIDLRKLMDRGGKVDEILTVQQNLSEVRGQIEQLDAQHQHDLHRVATSTITVALTEDRPDAAPAKPGPSARIDGAWHSGLNALADTVISFLSTIVWCWPTRRSRWRSPARHTPRRALLRNRRRDRRDRARSDGAVAEA